MRPQSKLSAEEGRLLLGIARLAIDAEIGGRPPAEARDEDLPAVCRERRGVFVTLTVAGGLRGCIGHIVAQGPLVEGVRANALHAAFRDPRFLPLSRAEWGKVEIEVSILSEPQPLKYSGSRDLLEKLQPGKDGVIVKKEFRQATFLPQVWEQLPDKKDFLTQLCLKAGLEADAWQKGGLEVSTYQVQAFEE